MVIHSFLLLLSVAAKGWRKGGSLVLIYHTPYDESLNPSSDSQANITFLPGQPNVHGSDWQRASESTNTFIPPTKK